MLMFLVIVILFVIWWVYYCKKYPCNSIELSDMIKKAKTGDLLLMHAFNSKYCYIIGHFTHIGVIVKIEEEVYLFHAFKPSPEQRKNGITGIELAPISDYIKNYKGYVYYKKYTPHIPVNENVIHFIDWVKKNMYYTLSVTRNALGHLFSNEPLSLNTNCGELAYIFLMYLNILDFRHFTKNTKHHLHWLGNLYKTEYGYYDIPLKIIK